MTYETAEGGCWRGLKFYPKPKINDLKLCLVRVSRRQFLEHVILCVGGKVLSTTNQPKYDDALFQ
jgi:hypothetical protein